jgi:predicted O-methyltransferase YrrM
MEKYNIQTLCEVGVRQGYNFERMIEHKPNVAVAVDIWQNTGVASQNDEVFTQEELDEQYKRVMDMEMENESVHVYKNYSHDVSLFFKDGFFDLVYIDADHTYTGVLQDIRDWYPKVKKGGFLLGDDFRQKKTHSGVRFGVMDAVTDFTRENKLSFFVFPTSKWGLIK